MTTHFVPAASSNRCKFTGAENQKIADKLSSQLGCSRCMPHQIGERCHENAPDCLRLDRCGGDAGDASTCRLLTRLPSRRTMPGVQYSVPAKLRSAAAILWSIALLCSAPAILWSIALLCSGPAILRLRLSQPNLTVLTIRVPETRPLLPTTVAAAGFSFWRVLSPARA